jgi:hypothetical protein
MKEAANCLLQELQILHKIKRCKTISLIAFCVGVKFVPTEEQRMRPLENRVLTAQEVVTAECRRLHYEAVRSLYFSQYQGDQMDETGEG